MSSGEDLKKLSGLSLNAIPTVPRVDPNWNLDYQVFIQASHKKKPGQFSGSEAAVLRFTREAQSLWGSYVDQIDGWAQELCPVSEGASSTEKSGSRDTAPGAAPASEVESRLPQTHSALVLSLNQGRAVTSFVKAPTVKSTRMPQPKTNRKLSHYLDVFSFGHWCNVDSVHSYWPHFTI